MPAAGVLAGRSGVAMHRRIGASIDGDAAQRAALLSTVGSVAKPSPGRRARSRKRRPDRQRRRERPPERRGPARGSQRHVGITTDLKAAGERPPPPWHPVPLSELLILIGIVGAVVAWARGYESHGALLGASIGAVVLGTLEVSVREHLSGFRPHTGLLAVIPPLVLHSGVVLVLLATSGRVPAWLNYALLPLDVLLAALGFKLLRARFVRARRARTSALGR